MGVIQEYTGGSLGRCGASAAGSRLHPQQCAQLAGRRRSKRGVGVGLGPSAAVLTPEGQGRHPHQMRESFSMGGTAPAGAEASRAAASEAWRKESSCACTEVTCRRHNREGPGRQPDAGREAAARGARPSCAIVQRMAGWRWVGAAASCAPPPHLAPQARLLSLVSRQVGLRPRAGVPHLRQASGGAGGAHNEAGVDSRE